MKPFYSIIDPFVFSPHGFRWRSCKISRIPPNISIRARASVVPVVEAEQEDPHHARGYEDVSWRLSDVVGDVVD